MGCLSHPVSTKPGYGTSEKNIFTMPSHLAGILLTPCQPCEENRQKRLKYQSKCLNEQKKWTKNNENVSLKQLISSNDSSSYKYRRY